MFLNIVLQGLGGGSPLTSIIFFVGVFAVMYFFFIRPQTAIQNEAKAFLQTLAVGQKVVVAGGIHGEIARIDGDILSIKIDKMTTIRTERDSVVVDRTKKLAADVAATNG